MTEAPNVPAWFQNGFHKTFLRPFLKRHFHAVAVERASQSDLCIEDGEPLVIYANHPSWWDPLIAHFLNRSLFPNRQFYAPIDAAALKQYRVFAKLGFYGVEMQTNSGAAAFLKQSVGILQSDSTALWMTPEGRFADVRDHSAELMPGLAHLCSRMTSGVALPVAIEYVFWEERLPVCLVRLGVPTQIADHSELTKSQWSELLDLRLRESQARLEELAIARCSEPFDNLMKGKTRAGGFYDSFRRAKAFVTRKPFQSQHGRQFQ